MFRLGRTTDEEGSIIVNFLKFSDQILKAPSEKGITVINTRQNEIADESFENVIGEIVKDVTGSTDQSSR